ncbi:MAG: TRZ/ATZ family hydrolase [Gammaproteobacteria bacterium]
MQTAETLYEARWIIPVEPAGIVLDEHTLVVAADRIVALLSRADARARYPAAERVDLDHHALLPGFVNAHTHAAMTLLRGCGAGLPLHDWLRRAIWPVEQALVGPEFVRDGSRLAIAEMIRGGTTCFADQYFFPQETALVCADAGMRAALGIAVIDVPTAYAANADEYLQRGLELHDEWRGHALVRTMFAPHAPYTVGDATLARIRSYADELDLPIHMHLHETATEVADALTATGERPLARLARLGLLSSGFSAVHMTQLDDADLDALLRTGAGVVHCPQSNLKLASGFCPVARLLDAGVPVALGTDGAACNDGLDMLTETKVAALLAKGVAADAAALPAHAALHLATLAGAHALGLAQQTGSLVAGKSADFIAINLDDFATTPVHDAAAAIVYAATRSQVTDSWITGRPLMRAGVLLTVDEAAGRERAARWVPRIAAVRRGTAA